MSVAQRISDFVFILFSPVVSGCKNSEFQRYAITPPM
jgi:hypothetical protein